MIRYSSVDNKQFEMNWVEVLDISGLVRRFTNPDNTEKVAVLQS